MGQGITQNQGSFRDPAGSIYEDHEHVYRVVTEAGRKSYELIAQHEIIAKAVAAGFLIASRELPHVEWPQGCTDAAYVIEHQRISYISYPYEWSFYQLKDAALHHLDFQLFLLQRNFALKDASSYNLQFIGAKPVFIDLLSIVPYQEGDYWWGHSQFCEQFLNPLLLYAVLGVAHNDWFRGRLEGIATTDLARFIPFYKKFNWNILTQIVLQARLEQTALTNQDKVIAKTKKIKPLSKLAYEGLLQQMRRWITKLHPKNNNKSFWGEYTKTHTYEGSEVAQKQQFIVDFMRVIKPQVLVDLGCNSGDYSLLAIEHGAVYVVGFDYDNYALDLAYTRAKEGGLPFLPLYLDAANPSPNQGWMQAERFGFAERTKVPALIALAFIHHLAIAKNIPLAQLIDWLMNIAPHGVLEFVPKNDQTISKMLALREDIFINYNQATFEQLLMARAKIIKQQSVSATGRVLYWYERKT